MNSTDAFVKEYQERFEKKLKENEITLLEHWKEQMDSVASIQLQITKISEMMANRAKVLKKG
jgi:hypothetical protein